jgi:recombinase-like protein
VKQPVRGRIEKPGEAANVTWQTRTAQPSDYENRLGDALEKIFDSGAIELGEVVKGLNDLKILSADGKPWTEASFQQVMQKLGA